jgi:hypothetical protein
LVRSTFGSRAFAFYRNLVPPSMPRGVVVMNPYTDPAALGYVRAFLGRHFSDNARRTLVLGINPGRFGAGITGVTFTDPVALADFCGIPNDLPRKRELSSVFIYDVIERLGGPAGFYRRFFLSAISPLGFTRGGVNLNYYDVPELARRITPFIIKSIRDQIELGILTRDVIILGRGSNAKFFARINEEHGFFRNVHVLEHPRWILQYRRKSAEVFVRKYAETLTAAAP